MLGKCYKVGQAQTWSWVPHKQKGLWEPPKTPPSHYFTRKSTLACQGPWLQLLPQNLSQRNPLQTMLLWVSLGLICTMDSWGVSDVNDRVQTALPMILVFCLFPRPPPKVQRDGREAGQKWRKLPTYFRR